MFKRNKKIKISQLSLSYFYLFRVDVSKGLTISHMASHPPDARYPDATAITYDEQNFKVTVVYNDHSVYVWDVRDIKKVFFYFINWINCQIVYLP